jgi:HK97 family phage major capsid protein/HK97 family phage prohead protease
MPDEPRIEIRAASSAPSVTDGSGRPRLAGHFARFGVFNEIDSATEGRFLERIEPGAFARTFKNNGDRIRMLFQHGRDPQIGDKPIGDPEVLREDKVGPYFEGDLFDSVPALVVDGLRAGQYGISYRFSVPKEKDVWDHNPQRSDFNPLGLPERTILEAKVYEFGPVTFPADPGADYAVRALTLTDLDAAFTPPEQTPALPAGPEAEPHSDEGTREEPIPVAPPPKETRTVDYSTPEERLSRITELKQALAREAVEYPGVLPTEAQARWDTDTAELAKLERDQAAWDERQAYTEQLGSDPRKLEPATYSPPMVVRTKTETDIYDPANMEPYRYRSTEQWQGALRDNAMRSIEQASYPHPASRPDEARTHIANLLDYKDTPQKELAQRILVTGSPIYRRAFNKRLLGASLSPEEERVANAVVGTTTTGGYMVPYQFDPTIVPIGTWTSINPYRQYCTIEQLVGANVWKAVASGPVTATRTTEAAATTENAPTYETQEITVKRVQAQVTFSIETEQDRPDFASSIATLLNEAKDTEEENAFTLGDGSGSAPFGMGGVHGTTNGFWTLLDTNGAAVAKTDLGLAEAALPLRWRMNAHWFFCRGMIRTVQAFETAYGELFNGQYYGGVGNPASNRFGNTGLQLLGYPVIETPSVPNTPSTVSTLWGMFGDPKQFIIVDRVGMNIELIPHVFGAAQGILTTGQRAIYAMWRNSAATRGAVGAATTGGLRLYVKS